MAIDDWYKIYNYVARGTRLMVSLLVFFLEIEFEIAWKCVLTGDMILCLSGSCSWPLLQDFLVLWCRQVTGRQSLSVLIWWHKKAKVSRSKTLLDCTRPRLKSWSSSITWNVREIIRCFLLVSWWYVGTMQTYHLPHLFNIRLTHSSSSSRHMHSPALCFHKGLSRILHQFNTIYTEIFCCSIPSTVYLLPGIPALQYIIWFKYRTGCDVTFILIDRQCIKVLAFFT